MRHVMIEVWHQDGTRYEYLDAGRLIAATAALADAIDAIALDDPAVTAALTTARHHLAYAVGVAGTTQEGDITDVH